MGVTRVGVCSGICSFLELGVTMILRDACYIDIKCRSEAV